VILIAATSRRIAAHIDGRDRVFVFLASKQIDKSELSTTMQGRELPPSLITKKTVA